MIGITECKCHGCERRTVGCHDSCEDYAEYKARRKDATKRRNIQSVGSGYNRDKYRRLRERKRLKG